MVIKIPIKQKMTLLWFIVSSNPELLVYTRSSITDTEEREGKRKHLRNEGNQQNVSVYKNLTA